MRKKIEEKDPSYIFTDAKDIRITLNGILKHRQDDKRENRKGVPTLVGIYKHIRQMPTFSSLGDYIVLSMCVQWLKGLKLTVDEVSIRRCMRYSKELKGQMLGKKALVNYLVK